MAARPDAVRRPRWPAGLRLSLCHAVWAVLVLGCAVPISYYDATTYRNLTELKAEAMTLVETFDTKVPAQNEAAIDAVQLALRKAHEYELGKGDPNGVTTQQLGVIMQLLQQDVADYRTASPGDLGPRYFQEAAGMLSAAFDIAIATENQKNRDKR
jgi:hypothetical protein